MKRTHKLLQAFLSPIVSGAMIGACGASGCGRSPETPPASERNGGEVREKAEGNATGVGEKKAHNKEEFDEERVEKAAKEILAVLPTQPVVRSKWVTKDDLARQLPQIKSELLEKALASLRDDRTIAVFSDESGALRYAQSYDAEAVKKASIAILAVLAQQPDERAKWVTQDDLAKKFPGMSSEFLAAVLDSLKEDEKITVFKDESRVERYGPRYTDQG